jgi:hypothetical protein
MTDELDDPFELGPGHDLSRERTDIELSVLADQLRAAVDARFELQRKLEDPVSSLRLVRARKIWAVLRFLPGMIVAAAGSYVAWALLNDYFCR